jgi:MFS family permease
MELAQSRNVGWEKIFALAALDAGIVISWTAYHNFQPKLISHFHFEHLAGFVLIAQSIVMLAIPLLAGLVTDYYRKKTGSGFSVFAIGISVASLVFMAVAFTISDQTFINLTWLLPTLIVFWLISMNIFHSPANSILEAFSKSPKLPLMMSALVICKIVIHGAEPVLISTLEAAGGAFTFLTGGVILVVTGIWFARSTRNMEFAHTPGETEINRFHIVVLFGLLAGLCNSLILHFFPEILRAKFGGSQSIFQDRLYISMMLGFAAVATVPLSFVVRRVGIYKSLVFGLLIAFTAMIIILASGNMVLSIVFSAILAMAYGLVLITSFPHALHNISPERATFGTGIFFASFEFFEVMFKLLGEH